MNQSIKKINKDIRIGLRINQSEYNVLKNIHPKNISLAIRQLIRDYSAKNKINYN